ncbi:transposase [Salmonella enterica subsp. enterica]|uniref:Transposase n=1 Tax=Salmonella enterica I TaxID=59201 RepID=A0A379WV34_SALET|nr:transposase [Salmonella enterica subsp. enterica]
MSSTAIYVPVRLLKRYRQLGPLGMSNHSRGRAGNRLLPTSLIDQALRIIREHYRDFDPTLARENLAEVHGLVLGKETIRRLIDKSRNLDPSQTTCAENSSASLPEEFA